MAEIRPVCDAKSRIRKLFPISLVQGFVGYGYKRAPRPTCAIRLLWESFDVWKNVRVIIVTASSKENVLSHCPKNVLSHCRHIVVAFKYRTLTSENLQKPLNLSVLGVHLFSINIPESAFGSNQVLTKSKTNTCNVNSGNFKFEQDWPD